jgi:regulator of protease activity HflC (stomatin/prohibitin superfamily)
MCVLRIGRAAEPPAILALGKGMTKRSIIIKDTHRGLWYENGVLVKLLEAGRYKLPLLQGGFWGPWIEIVLVDVRERELTIKGQEILTADKVAIRVSIIVQFRVTDPRAAIHEVEKYEERLYSDVQLAARRSLASMTLDEILTNRNRLSEDILHDVKEIAARYGVLILRADVKDLVFPGNLQEIMNKVLAAERTAQAQLVEAKTRAQTQQIAAEAQAEISRVEAEALAQSLRLQSEAEAGAQKIRIEAEIAALRDSEQSAQAYSTHPALLRLRELETLKELARSANARLYISFDKPAAAEDSD